MCSVVPFAIVKGTSALFVVWSLKTCQCGQGRCVAPDVGPLRFCQLDTSPLSREQELESGKSHTQRNCSSNMPDYRETHRSCTRLLLTLLLAPWGTVR